MNGFFINLNAKMKFRLIFFVYKTPNDHLNANTSVLIDGELVQVKLINLFD